MLVVPKAIADKPQAMTFYNMMDYKPNALLGIIIAITMIIFNTFIILILLIIKTSLSTPCVRIITKTSTTIIIFAIKIKMSHPCLAKSSPLSSSHIYLPHFFISKMIRDSSFLWSKSFFLDMYTSSLHILLYVRDVSSFLLHRIILSLLEYNRDVQNLNLLYGLYCRLK